MNAARPLALFLALGSAVAAGPGSAQAQAEADLSWYEDNKAGPAETPADEPYHDERDASAGGSDGGQSARRASGPQGFGVGLSLAYALPTGDFAQDAPYTRYAKGAVRPAADLHYFVTPALGFGVYGGFGIGIQSDDFNALCERSGADCRLLLIDTGAFAEYRLEVTPNFKPFVQLNVGYEHYRNKLSASQSAAGVTVSATAKIRAHGVGFGTTLGADVVRGRIGGGPFVSAQFGSYRTLSFDSGVSGLGTDSGSGDLQTAMHYTIQFGLRGHFEARR